MAVYKVSVENAAYQGMQTLKTNRNKRHRSRTFLVEGVRNIDAASKYNWQFDALIYDGGAKISKWAHNMLETYKFADIYMLTPELMKKLSSKTDTSELLAIVHMKDDDTVLVHNAGNKKPVFVLCDRPTSKGNLGAILRSCDAFGVEALFYAGHSVDIYDPEVLASSMGSFFAVPFAPLSETGHIDGMIARLRREHPGLLVAGTSAHAEIAICDADLNKPLLFIIGNETDGLSWRFKQISDVLVTIPMSENSFASSLNASCAVTALFYEAARQRR
jgi:TrmH family RNA methyltransferase